MEMETYENMLLGMLSEKNIIHRNGVIKPLSGGMSGAALYDIIHSGEGLVVKNYNVKRMSEAPFDIKQGEKEYAFYSISSGIDAPYLPEVVYMGEDNNFGKVIVIKKYKAMSPVEWSHERLLAATDIYAHISGCGDMYINALGIKKEPYCAVSEKVLDESMNLWAAVLDKHDIEKCTLGEIRKDYHRYERFLYERSNFFNHGDVGPSNFVTDGDGSLVCIDWQNPGFGGRADLSHFFYMCRISGIKADETALMEYFCEMFTRYSGIETTLHELNREFYASTLTVQFRHSAYYNRDAGRERVKSDYDAMLKAYEWLNADNTA